MHPLHSSTRAARLLIGTALLSGWLAGCGARTEPPTTAALSEPGPPFAVAEVWARATPVASTGSVYLTLTNQGTQADTLIGASSPAAASVELHRSVTEDGIARMRPAGEITLAPGEVLRAEPGGLHLMLNELRQPLVEGERIPLELRFRDAAALQVEVEIRSLTAGIDAHEHTQDAGQEHTGH